MKPIYPIYDDDSPAGVVIGPLLSFYWIPSVSHSVRVPQAGHDRPSSGYHA